MARKYLPLSPPPPTFPGLFTAPLSRQPLRRQSPAGDGDPAALQPGPAGAAPETPSSLPPLQLE